MKTVHLTNIGGQALPVLQGISEFPCEKYIFLHSSESEVYAKKISETIIGEVALLPVSNPNHYFELLEVCSEICTKHPDSQFFVNVSSGTKIMSLALFSHFTTQNQKNQVFHIDQNGFVNFLSENRSQALKKLLPISSYIAYSGQKVKSLTRFSDIDQELFRYKDILKRLFEKPDQAYHQLCKQYFNYRIKNKNNESFELIDPRTYSSVKWEKDCEELTFSMFRKFKTAPDEYVFTGLESVGLALEAKWFELEVAELLSKWKYTSELVWSLVVPYESGNDKNEIDLIVNTGTKLLFVECKTQISDIKDIDKFRNVTKNYGGLGSKSLLITHTRPADRFIEKCKDNQILLFYFREKNQAVNSENDLYCMLNQEIHRTNTF